MRKLMTVSLAFLCLIAAPTLTRAADPIATTEGQTPGATVEVRELKVSNGTVMLKFTLVNDGDQPFSPDTLADRTVNGPDYKSISGIYLIDLVNK